MPRIKHEFLFILKIDISLFTMESLSRRASTHSKERRPLQCKGTEDTMKPIQQTTIQAIHGRQILDSRGVPTIEAQVILKNGLSASASSPSGTSGCTFEACELRDHLPDYHGQGVTAAINQINTPIREALLGEDCTDQWTIDRKLSLLDGTPNKSKLGVNTMLAVSLACAKAAAKCCGTELYRYLGGINANRLPAPLISLISGGNSSKNQMELAEILMLPVSAKSFSEALKLAADVFIELGRLLRQEGFSSATGIHGEYMQDQGDDGQMLGLIMKAVQNAGYQPNYDVTLTCRAKASGWYKNGHYIFPKQQKKITQADLIKYWTDLASQYPVSALIDPLAEEDFAGFQELTSQLGNSLRVIGSDLFASRIERIQQGLSAKAVNAVLIKPSQIGTLSEILEAASAVRKAGMELVLSQYDGETGDTFLSDLAVAIGADQILAGAPTGFEHVGKYNRLTQIESSLSGSTYSESR